jgi:hypothetical protein
LFNLSFNKGHGGNKFGKKYMLVVILCLNFALCLKIFMNLWGLSEGGEGISLTNNSIILPIGVAEGVFIKILGRMVSTDYLVIECVGNGQITLGRSAKAPRSNNRCGKRHYEIHFPPGNHHEFPKGKSKDKRGRRNASGVDASSFENI